jgi:RimJ/RimL family protein N-acetyltransferase
MFGWLAGMERTHVYRLCAGDARRAETSGGDVTIVTLDASELGQLATIGPCELDEYRERLARSDACYAASVAGELAHSAWVQRAGEHSIDHAGLVVPIRAGELWIYNCRTANVHRGKGIYPQVLRRIVDDHFVAGYTRAWIYTSDDNVASQKGIVRAGFTAYETLRALRLGSMVFRLGA